jgi:purine-binding chemotaxis protein CheW
MMLYVVFKVGDADYALPANEVVQMETFSGATRVPGTADYVAGLVQIRGRVIPVIDLRARFGLPPIERTLDSRVIVVRDGERHVGLLADSAREVLKLDEAAFQPPPGVVGLQAAGFLHSVAQAKERLLMRVDFSRVIGNAAVPQENEHGEKA